MVNSGPGEEKYSSLLLLRIRICEMVIPVPGRGLSASECAFRKSTGRVIGMSES